MNRKPMTIYDAANILKPPNAEPRKKKSVKALIGIPRTVPREINKGYVKAMPKLIKKLKIIPRNACPQRYFHGIFLQVRSS